MLQINSTNGLFTLDGQSIAGNRSCISVNELGICFDLGYCSDSSVRQEIVLITHGHADHIGSLHLHAFQRKLINASKPIYIMPFECIDGFNIAHDAYKKLNRHVDANISHFWMTRQYTIVTNNEFVIRDLIIRSYPTIHIVPSQGYCVFRQKRKLKQDFIELSQNELVQLKNNGINISEIQEFPLIGYTGDSCINGIIKHQEFLNIPVLIMECTYLICDFQKNDTPEEAHKRGHIHEKDIIDHQELFKNEAIVLTHLSPRYNSEHINASLERLRNIFEPRNIKIFIY